MPRMIVYEAMKYVLYVMKSLLLVNAKKPPAMVDRTIRTIKTQNYPKPVQEKMIM